MAHATKINDSSDAPGTELSAFLARIHPKHSPAYSKRLHQWLKTHGRSGDNLYQVSSGSKLARVYGSGSFFIGQPYNDYEGDTDFSGAMLMQVLCMGRSVIRACFSGDAPELIEVAGFWGRYEVVGRCAIDPTHQIDFRDNDKRFHAVHGQQFCKWCSSPVACI